MLDDYLTFSATTTPRNWLNIWDGWKAQRESMADNSEVRDDLKYTVNDEWAKAEGENVRVGITDHCSISLPT